MTAPEGRGDDRRGSGFNDRQLEQLQTMVHASVREQVQQEVQARGAEEVDAIAEKAASRAIEKLTDEAYRAVGKTIVQKLIWIVGLLTVAAGAWAMRNGWIKP